MGEIHTILRKSYTVFGDSLPDKNRYSLLLSGWVYLFIYYVLFYQGDSVSGSTLLYLEALEYNNENTLEKQ